MVVLCHICLCNVVKLKYVVAKKIENTQVQYKYFNIEHINMFRNFSLLRGPDEDSCYVNTAWQSSEYSLFKKITFLRPHF